MKLIIDIPDDVYDDIEHGKSDYINYYINSLNWAVRNGIPVADKLRQIREEIKSTYYSQGDGFDDFPHGYMFAKDEDMKIIDKYLQRADMRGAK